MLILFLFSIVIEDITESMVNIWIFAVHKINFLSIISYCVIERHSKKPSKTMSTAKEKVKIQISIASSVKSHKGFNFLEHFPVKSCRFV